MIAPLPSAPLTPNEERLRKAQAEKNALRKSYNAAKRAEAARMVESYPIETARLRVLIAMIRKMGEDEGARIVEWTRNSFSIIDAPEDMRAFALSRIGIALMRRREALGLVPFDDPLPPKRNAYGAIKDLLNVR